MEKIQVEVAGSYGLDGKIDINELKNNLKHLNLSDEDIIPTIKDEIETFPLVVKIDNYEYDILEDGMIDKHVDFVTLESLYGKVVNGYTGYTATDVTKWKLYYVDEKDRELFIISSNVVPAPQPTENGIPLISKQGFNYTGSKDVLGFEYGRKYNGLWLKKCCSGNSNKNAKAVAYLCDPINWEQYKIGKAKYVAGGPTFELLQASCKHKQIYEVTFDDVLWSGYFAKSYTELKNNSLYNLWSRYWLSSPNPAGGQANVNFFSESSGVGNSRQHTATDVGLRPVVCLPASSIEISGEGENITLNYK